LTEIKIYRNEHVISISAVEFRVKMVISMI
jgi:hypothetical protein